MTKEKEGTFEIPLKEILIEDFGGNAFALQKKLKDYALEAKKHVVRLHNYFGHRRAKIPPDIKAYLDKWLSKANKLLRIPEFWHKKCFDPEKIKRYGECQVYKSNLFHYVEVLEECEQMVTECWLTARDSEFVKEDIKNEKGTLPYPPLAQLIDANSKGDLMNFYKKSLKLVSEAISLSIVLSDTALEDNGIPLKLKNRFHAWCKKIEKFLLFSSKGEEKI